MGMSDNVTLALGASGYNVHKLVLFGSFGDVMPWMLRFARTTCVWERVCESEWWWHTNTYRTLYQQHRWTDSTECMRSTNYSEYSVGHTCTRSVVFLNHTTIEGKVTLETTIWPKWCRQTIRWECRRPRRHGSKSIPTYYRCISRRDLTWYGLLESEYIIWSFVKCVIIDQHRILNTHLPSMQASQRPLLWKELRRRCWL